jgi:hypothetical protein
MIATILIDTLGWFVVGLPWLVVLSTGVYQYWLWMSMIVAYVGIVLYNIAYIGGALSCRDTVAYAIHKDRIVSHRTIDYIPVIAIVTAAGYAADKSMSAVALLAITPIIINWLARIILYLKAKRINHDT